MSARAATVLADQPVTTGNVVPGNLALAMSVEFPTAVSVAHQDVTYSSASTYLGYFDPDKCYVYKFVDVETSTLMSHFAPAGVASTHTCVGANDYMWSGNYMNWATTQTIDPFRWAMTGGYRVVDTPSLTILEKAWASGQGGTVNFPDKVMSSATDIANATPFKDTGLTAYVQGRNQQVNFVLASAFGTGGFLGTYFKGTNWDYSGNTPVLTRTESINFPTWNGLTNTPDATVFASGEPFSVRWVSYASAPSAGTYQFQVLADDGIKVWVNGALIINNPVYSPFTTTASVTLTAGQAMNVRVEYFQSGGGANAILSWKPPGASGFSVYAGGVGSGSLGFVYIPIRVKVCDPTAPATPGRPDGTESNCQAYAGGNYKPEGLMQQYAKKLRYSVMSYTSETNVYRDGGVLRTPQKFVGPLKPVPGSSDVTNTAAEWDASTGVMVTNPDASDATSTSTAYGISTTNSGALNYLNKFGEIITNNFRQFDPVSELFYGTLRYYKNQGNVSAWSDMSSAPDAATRARWADAFPIVRNWVDPILYSCQKNFILGIGDVNTNADRNVAGSTTSSLEPALPPEIAADTTVNSIAATNKVGSLENLPAPYNASLGYALNWPSGCCNNHSDLIAGLAYDANTRDIRPDLPGTQTVQTFWVDVLEYQVYWPNNQYYLAAKYGGFKVPSGLTYPANNYANDPSLQDSWWYTNTDLVGTQRRPDNYYTAGRPDQMVSGLTNAFASIAAQSGATTTGNAVPVPQVASGGGNISYAANWDSSSWTGDLVAYELTYSTVNGVLTPVQNQKWALSDKLASQLVSTSSPAFNGWDTNRRLVTWNPATSTGVPFRIGGSAAISATQATALTPSYVSGVANTDMLNYLRGNRSLEGSKLRPRSKLLGDIIGAKPTVVGPPSLPLSDSSNAGYSAFRAAWTSRPTTVYVGSNDGILHAVNGTLTGTAAGNELFGYVPTSLFQGPSGTPSVDGLASLGNPSFTHHFMVDSPPGVYDIDFGKTAGNSGTDWHSVLVGGLGKGGKSYYAMDVTDPTMGVLPADTSAQAESKVASKVLWEFSDSRLGFSYGQPAVVKTRQYGWVMIFPSGYNNADGQGYFLIVNPRTGALIQAVSTGTGSVGNDAGLAQLNAFVLDRTDGTADSVYAGDLLGNVWRVDLTTATGSYSAPVKVAVLTDAGGVAQPVTSRPLIEVSPTSKRRYILLGTGRLLANSDVASSQVQSYYGIIDGTNARFNASTDLPSGISFPIPRSKLAADLDPTVGVTVNTTTQMGWYLDLGSSWRVLGDSSPFFGKVSFASNLPSVGDPCAPSTSRLYSIDFDGAKSELLDSTNNNVAYLSFTSSITDIQNLSVSGQRQLTTALSNGSGPQAVKTASIPTLPLRRLNWREVPIAN